MMTDSEIHPDLARQIVTESDIQKRVSQLADEI
jgi:hypothetical protein